MPDTPDLAQWLLQQITEDEGAARAAPNELGLGWIDSRVHMHIMNWSPARVLAECEAKRRIIEAHEAVCLEDFEPWCTTCGCLDCDPTSAAWPCATLRLIALPFADREGYDESWRP